MLCRPGGGVGEARTPPRLLGRRGARELDVLDAERVERLGDRDLGLGVEERVRELLALCGSAQYGGGTRGSGSDHRPGKTSVGSHRAHGREIDRVKAQIIEAACSIGTMSNSHTSFRHTVRPRPRACIQRRHNRARSAERRQGAGGRERKLALTAQRALDDLEVADVAQEVGRARRVRVEGALRLRRGAVGGAVRAAVRLAVRDRRRTVHGDLDHLGVGGLRGAVRAGTHVVLLCRG